MSVDQVPQPPDEPTRSARPSLLKRTLAAQGAVPALLTVSALAVVLLLAAIRPAQNQGAQVGTVPRPTRSATPSTTRTITLTPSPTSTPSATPTSTETPLPPMIYEVVSGDSAAAISEKFGVSIESIITANNLDEAGTMYPGDKLKIPYPTATSGPTTPAPTAGAASASSANAAATPTAGPGSPTPSASPQPLMHELAQGETLETIAAKYGVTVDALTQANQIANPSGLQVGQQLVIPGRLVTATPAPARTVTPTTGAPYPAPRLLYPADGAPFRGADAVIVVEWASVALLRDDEWYELTLQDPSGLATTVRTKATSWRIPAAMRPNPDADAHTFLWHVDVVRGSQEGEISVRIGDLSQIRKFRWD